jgi:undecaprenyl-diphosphatase
VRPQNFALSNLSTIIGLGLAGLTLLDLERQGGGRAAVTSLEAAVWSAGATEWAKTLVGRKRPVLYTSSAPGVARSVDAQRSMPSGHSALAFSLATSYVLYTWNREGNRTGAVLAGAAAAAVGALRVVSARHFPSDVLVGALLGIAVGTVAYQIRY